MVLARSRHTRSGGSVATVALVAMVPLLGAIGAIAVDLMHNNDTIGALQRATDAGALAGAQDLSTYKGAPLNSSATTADTSTPGSNEDAVNHALQVTALNVADGRGVATNVVPGAVVTATLSPIPNPSKCTVNAQLPIRSLMAVLFGNTTQTITAHSVAGMGKPLNRMGGFMPILLSSTDVDSAGKTLATSSLNSVFSVTIKGNGIWVLNPSINDSAAIDYISDPTKYAPVSEPPITVGSTINSDNGIKNAGSEFNKVVGMTVFFPVTSDHVGTSTPSHVVIGFVGMKVTGANPHNPSPSLTGVLVPAVGPGVDTGSGQNAIFTSYPFFSQGATVDTAHLIE